MSDKKQALVTGSTSPIGRRICLMLAENGYDIAIHYNNSKEQAKILCQDIVNLGRQSSIYKADFCRTTQVNELINQVLLDFPHLNLLINNASIFKASIINNTSVQDFDDNFNIHVKVPFLLMQTFSKNCTGNVINIVDSNIVRSNSKYVPYLLSKKSLLELTKFAAFEFAPNIRVNAICPGIIEQDVYIENIPLKKTGNINNILQAIEFILKNDFLTGESIFVDGGMKLRS